MTEPYPARLGVRARSECRMPFSSSRRHTTNKALSRSWAHAPAFGSPQDERAHEGDVPNFIKYHCFAKTNNPSLKSHRHRRYRNSARAHGHHQRRKWAFLSLINTHLGNFALDPVSEPQAFHRPLPLEFYGKRLL